MTIQSMDAVLADAEAPVHDETEAEVLAPEADDAEGQEEAEGNQDDGRDAHGALHAERQRVKRKYTETVADFERRLTEANTGFEKKLTDTLAENDRRWEQRFNTFAQQLQQPRQEPKTEPEVVPDIFENPNGFVEHNMKKALDPVEQRIAKITEGFSRRMAIKEHGAEKVQAAFGALDQAAKSGNRDAIEFVAKVKQSDDPFGDIMDWHSKSSVISEVGNDPAAFIQKKLDEALNDPAFLAKAAEKLGVKMPAAPKTPSGQQPLPSVNRVTAAADEDGDEEDAREVFNSALRGGARR
ncbi:hypothetical protein ACE102_33735 [Bradyrhizobium sp. vgs-9]|uniref:hypothetical protein n=1 Tax=Bradyrhizobium sp. vgs-9 TaxID=208389 RepID=UPI0035D5098B